MNDATDIRLRSNRGRTSRAANLQKWGSLIGGSALAVYGLTRRSRAGAALAAAGGTIAVLGSRSRNNGHAKPTAHATVLLNCTPERAFEFWHNFENLPRFMRHLESVSVTGDRRSRWTAIGPMGKRVSWNAEITNERPNESISWQSLPGSDVEVNGTVEFRPAPADRGTVVSADIRYQPPGGTLGKIAAQILGKNPRFLMEQDLRRLKALIETGELPTTEGQSHGPRDRMTGAFRAINPDQPIGSSTNATGTSRRAS